MELGWHQEPTVLRGVTHLPDRGCLHLEALLGATKLGANRSSAPSPSISDLSPRGARVERVAPGLV